MLINEKKMTFEGFELFEPTSLLVAHTKSVV